LLTFVADNKTQTTQTKLNTNSTTTQDVSLSSKVCGIQGLGPFLPAFSFDALQLLPIEQMRDCVALGDWKEWRPCVALGD